MAKKDRVNQVVTAAVIEALNKDQSGLVAEITADVINEKDNYDYGFMRAFYSGCGHDKTYLERIARDHVRKLAAEAVTHWIDERQDTIRDAVVGKLDAEALADSYVKRLLGISADSIDISVSIETPSSEDDD